MQCLQSIGSRGGFSFVLFVLCSLLLASNAFAAPGSLAWRRAGVPCGELEAGVRSFLDDLSSRAESTEATALELERALSFIVMHEACSLYGKSCDFPLCQKFRSSDPLAWLSQGANCSELSSEYGARFIAAGGVTSLSTKEKTLARYSKKQICSESNLACKIELCGVRSAKLRAPISKESVIDESEENTALVSASESVVNSMNESASREVEQTVESVETKEDEKDPLEEVDPLRLKRALLEDRYNENLLEDRSLRRGLVRLAISAEQKKKSDWLRGGNPEELKVVAQRRSSAKKRDRATERTGYSGTNAGLVNQGRFQVRKPVSRGGMSRPGGLRSRPVDDGILAQ